MKPILMFFNGPPHCGKDTAVGQALPLFVSKGIRVTQCEFKAPLRTMAIAFSNLTPMAANSIEYYGDKDAPQELIPHNRSWRQWLIHISENVMKPMFGPDVFGELMLRHIQELELNTAPQVICFSDCGFESELNVLHTAGYDCVLIRMHRTGCDFSNDSRNFVYLNGVYSVDMFNNGDIASLYDKIDTVYNNFLEYRSIHDV